jgi:hypothetical protein
MARQRLNVGHIFELPDGHLVIGLYTRSDELRDQWRNTPIPDVKSQYEGKRFMSLAKAISLKPKYLMLTFPIRLPTSRMSS